MKIQNLLIQSNIILFNYNLLAYKKISLLIKNPKQLYINIYSQNFDIINLFLDFNYIY